MGILIDNDYSSMEKSDSDYFKLKKLIKSNKNLELELTLEQQAILDSIKAKNNVIVSGMVFYILIRQKVVKMYCLIMFIVF